MRNIFLRASVLFALLLSAVVFARAQANPEMESALQAAQLVARNGPDVIALRDQARLTLPSGHVFIPAAEASGLLRAMGNRPGDDILGMVVPAGEEEWFVVLSYEASGYIKDDDAKEWNADELLESLRAGTEETNKERKRRGIPEIEIVGWSQPPAYDAQTHRLRWSTAARDKGSPANSEQGVNYNTYALGREGYISLNLVTGLADLPRDKVVADTLLGSLDFETGKRYADFNPATDHVAEYGLAALVAGVAAKKLGLFAVIAAFFAKFAKVIAIGALALAGGAFKFFKGKKDQA